MADLVEESGFILYLRDRAQLGYHFSKLGPEGWKAMVQGGHDKDPYVETATRIFYAPYNLPEFRSPISKLAATEFLAASRADRAPEWVIGLADVPEIRFAAR